MTVADYQDLITSARALGCTKMQFIGGEPTLNPALPSLIRHARDNGYEFIEVFTNATRISNSLLECFIQNSVCVATSFYSHQQVVHDAVTQKTGSHSATLSNITKLLTRGISLRVGIISMDQNKETVPDTISFLEALGVKQIGSDRVRSFGRASDLRSASNTDLSELCGSCWRGSICVSPQGILSPCIMAKRWTVGSLFDSDLATLVKSDHLKHIRARIYNEVWLPKVSAAAVQSTLHRPSDSGDRDCSPNCNPNCNPQCHPNCNPSCVPTCSPSCSPCFPFNKCNPQLFGR
jgi:hypothetical protein